MSRQLRDLSPLREYERQQGGYWLYGRDPFGADRVWVSVAEHEAARSAVQVGALPEEDE